MIRTPIYSHNLSDGTHELHLDGYNINSNTLIFTNEEDAFKCQKLLEERNDFDHDVTTQTGLWATDKSPFDFFDKAYKGLCSFIGNPDNYSYSSSELVEVGDAIEAIRKWRDISFRLGYNDDNI